MAAPHGGGPPVFHAFLNDYCKKRTNCVVVPEWTRYNDPIHGP